MCRAEQSVSPLYSIPVTLYNSASSDKRTAMVNQSTPARDDKDDAALPAAQAELLQSVLEPEAYPWLADKTAAAYGVQAEAAGQALEISDDEAIKGWQGLSTQLSQMFSQGERDGVVAQLKQKFADRLPVEMIARIGERAQQVVSSGEAAGQNALEQMLACVQDVLSYVAEDDLRVIGRPMATAMRGSSADELLDVTIKSVRAAEWEALSPIEQARLGLAAARYAISQAEKN